MLSFPALSINAFAQSDPITVTSQTDTISFPKSIDFQMQASDISSSITSATLYIKFNGSQETHQISANPPARKVALHWQEDTTRDNFNPPGTGVQYYWQLRDSAGHTHTDTIQTFSVVDTRFSWQQLSQGQLQVHWYNRPLTFGQAILQRVNTSLNNIAANLGSSLVHPANLWVYQSIDDFHGALPPQAHEWVGGIAFPDLNTAYIVAESTQSDTLVRDMPHELTHLIFHQLISQGIYAPIWFDEGLAVYNQLYHEPEMALRFKSALKAHTLLRLRNIALDFPTNADQAYLAYAQSWDLINYMYTTFGQTRMSKLIKSMNNAQNDFDTDLTQAFGMDQDHLENQWRLHLNQPAILAPAPVKPVQASQKPIHVQVATDTALPFLLTLGILLVVLPSVSIGVVFVRQQRRRTNRRLAQQAQYIMQTVLPPQYPPYQAYQQYQPYRSAPPIHPYISYPSIRDGNTEKERAVQPPGPAQSYPEQRPPWRAPQG
jgi:hypothetical protein